MAQTIITSHHIVKPSSPTPLASKTHKLSLLDQIAPPIFLPLIFFYKNDESKPYDEVSRRLKQSLSEILTIFYPLAGTVIQNSHVDCNDEGAEFVESRVHARLSQFLQNPKTEELQQFLPTDTSSYKENAVQLLVKVSFFDCGGISVGVCFPHKIGDFSSFATFMNAWAAICRNPEASRLFHPSFDLALHFPPRDLPPASGFSLGVTKEKVVTKRLVFDNEKLEKLKKKASSDEIKDPSRAEAVSAFLWRSFIQAHKAETRDTKTTSFTASDAVNLRPRAVPPLPDHAIGNCFASASAVASSEEDETVLASKLRAAVRAMDDDRINYNDFFKDENNIRSVGGLFKPGKCYFSNWWWFPVDEVDFGWGKPVRVCTGTMPFLNLVILMDTPSGDGIEAWINVPNDDFFQNFQANYDTLFT